MGLLNIDSDWLMNILRCAVTTQMLGRILNVLNKKKLKDFQNHMSQYFIHNRKHKHFLNGYILHFYPLNELISNLMPATGLKKICTGATTC